MPAPASPDAIRDVNTRYHDAAAAEYDSKWGIDFHAIGRGQVLGKMRKLVGDDFPLAFDANNGYSSGGAIRIGALTTHAELGASPVIKSECSMLCDAAGHVGDAQVRNCGTIGGNVAHADPASDLPTVLVALDARFVVAGSKGERTVAAGDFFKGMMTTALGAGEVLAAIEIPSRKPGQGMAYVKFEHPASRYAVLGAAAVVTMKNGACGSAQVAIGGLVPTPARLRDVETAVTGAKPSADVIAKAAAAASKQLGGDLLGAANTELRFPLFWDLYGAGFFDALRQDPILARVKLISEPWDIGPGGYQLGHHPPGFAEWNDRYRDLIRQDQNITPATPGSSPISGAPWGV